MHRIDSAGHVSHLWSNGVPGVTQGTLIDDAWMNAIQEEICSLIVDCGVTLVKGTNTQLFQALKVVFGQLGDDNEWVGENSFSGDVIFPLVGTVDFQGSTDFSYAGGTHTIAGKVVNKAVAKAWLLVNIDVSNVVTVVDSLNVDLVTHPPTVSSGKLVFWTTNSVNDNAIVATNVRSTAPSSDVLYLPLGGTVSSNVVTAHVGKAVFVAGSLSSFSNAVALTQMGVLVYSA